MPYRNTAPKKMLCAHKQGRLPPERSASCELVPKDIREAHRHLCGDCRHQRRTCFDVMLCSPSCVCGRTFERVFVCLCRSLADSDKRTLTLRSRMRWLKRTNVFGLPVVLERPSPKSNAVTLGRRANGARQMAKLMVVLADSPK